MSGAELALGILGGSVSSGSAPTTSALVAFKNYQRDQVAARTAFAEREDVVRKIDSFKKSVGKLSTVDDLLKDRKTLTFVLSAFGLESEVNNPGKLKAILNSDPDDINSFANRLSDSRFGELAAFVSAPAFGLKNLTVSDKQTQLIDKFLTNGFEQSLAAQNPAARDALFFLRRINSVENTFEILGDLPLRSIVTTALNLPAEIARQSVDKQAALIEAKFKLDNFKTSSSGSTSRSRLEILNDDLSTISSTNKTINASLKVADSLVAKLESLRASYNDYDTFVNPAGVNANEITVQQNAIPDLLRQRTLVEAANSAVQDTRSAITELEKLFSQARNASSEEDFIEIQDKFTALADTVLGDDGLINSATFTDPNTGLTQNLLRNGTGGALPAGTDSTPTEISTTVNVAGTRVITKSTDLAGFLSDLQTFRDGVSSATYATRQADLTSAETSFTTAKTTFSAAEQRTKINVSSVTTGLSSVKFAAELETQSLALGQASVKDALTRAGTISGVLDTIKSLANQALEPDADLAAINLEYDSRLSELQGLIQNAGSTTDGTTTVTYDNLLTSGTTTYDVLGGTVVQAVGGDLANDILTGLPASITVDNADALKTNINDVYKVALETVVDDLTRDKKVIDFATNTLDPRGALDAQIRTIQADLDKTIASAAVDKKNLLAAFASDLKVTLSSLSSTVTIGALGSFKADFSTTLDSFNTTVLSGGSIADRLQSLTDALFAAGRAQSNLKAEGYALNVQKSIITEEKVILEGKGGGASSFLKPIEFTPEALKFIERYLAQKDLEAQGVAVGGAQLSAKASLAGQIGSLLPQGSGFGLNLLA